MTFDNSLHVMGIAQLGGVDHANICIVHLLIFGSSAACARVDSWEHPIALPSARIATTRVEALRVDDLSVELWHVGSEAVVERLVLGLVWQDWRRHYVF